jgi:hypothetical protein
MSLLAAIGLKSSGAKSFLDDILGKTAAAENEKLFKMALADFQKSRKQSQNLQNLARVERAKALDTTRQGYAGARRNVAAQGAEAYRQVSDAGARAGGMAVSAAQQRGLTNTSAGAGMSAQAAYNTQRAAGSIAERLAGLNAQLDAAEGSAVAGQQQLGAQGLMQQGQQQMLDTNQLTQLLGSANYTWGPEFLQLLGQIGGKVAGGMAGGAGG